MTTDYSRCAETENGNHKPDFSTARPVEDLPGVIDVTCGACGLSGSVVVRPEDVVFE